MLKLLLFILTRRRGCFATAGQWGGRALAVLCGLAACGGVALGGQGAFAADNDLQPPAASVSVAYQFDEAMLDVSAREALTRALQSLQGKPLSAVFITTQNPWGPLAALQTLGRHRSKFILALLREQGVAVDDTILYEIHLQNPQKNSASVWFYAHNRVAP